MTTRIINGDCRTILKSLPDESVHCIVTSPPYFNLRDYGTDDQIGRETTPDEFVAALVEIFREARRVLRSDGTLWLNLGDSYASKSGGQPGDIIGSDGYRRNNRTERRSAGVPAGFKPKDRMMIPARTAIALQADGWWLRDEIVWHKPNAMPSSVSDRTTPAHEMIYLLTKSRRYYFDADAVKEPAVSDHASGNGFKRDARLSYQNSDGTARGNDQQWNDIGGKRNKRSVWTVTTKPFFGEHFATFPPDLILPCILAGCPRGGTVLDPFGGTGVVGIVATLTDRRSILIEINSRTAEIAKKRIEDEAGMFAEIALEQHQHHPTCPIPDAAGN